MPNTDPDLSAEQYWRAKYFAVDRALVAWQVAVDALCPGQLAKAIRETARIGLREEETWTK